MGNSGMGPAGRCSRGSCAAANLSLPFSPRGLGGVGGEEGKTRERYSSPTPSPANALTTVGWTAWCHLAELIRDSGPVF